MVLAALIAVRMAWMFSIPVFVRVARRGEPPQTRAELTVLGWSGMRGGVSLGRACPSAHRGAHLDRLAGGVYEYCSTRMRGTSAWRAGPDSRVQIGDLLSNVLDSRSDKKWYASRPIAPGWHFVQ